MIGLYELSTFWRRRISRRAANGVIAGTFFAAAGLAAPAAAYAGCDVPDNGMPEASMLPKSMQSLGGLRPMLASHGIGISADYTAEYFGNVSGGIARTGAYDGVLNVAVDADMHQLGFWKGLCFHTNGFQIAGEGITARGVGSLAPISNLEAVPATRLFEMYFDQSLYDDKVSVRIGQIAADSEFAISEGGGYFLNGTWGWPTITASDMPDGGPAYPLATPGVRVALHPNDNIDMMVAVFNGLDTRPCAIGDPQRCNDHGLEFPLGNEPLLMAEGAYRYKIGGLPGQAKLGGWNHFGKFNNQRFDSGGNLIAVTGGEGAVIDGDWGLYGIADQLVWRAPGSGDDDDAKGIGIFARVMGAPSAQNLVSFYTDMGVTFTGMIPSRPDDALAIGFAYTKISDQVHAYDVDAGSPVAENYESLVEVAYTWQVNDAWSLQPDFQYIWQPGGNVTDDNGDPIDHATVIGMRSNMSF
jgi:porin